MWRVRVVQSEQHMICRLTASGGQGGPSKHGRNWQRKTAVSGSSPQLTLKKGAPGDQVWDLLCVQLASYLERGPLMWMMPLHLHVNQKSDYDDDDAQGQLTLSSLVGLFVWFDSLCPINNLSVIKGQVFLGWTSTKLGLMFLLKDTTQWRRWGSNLLNFKPVWDFMVVLVTCKNEEAPIKIGGAWVLIRFTPL